jgi:hypothetical protein
VPQHRVIKTYGAVDVSCKLLNSSFNAADTSAACFDFTRSQVYKSRRKWGRLYVWPNICIIPVLRSYNSHFFFLPSPLTSPHHPSPEFPWAVCDDITFCVSPAFYFVRYDRLTSKNGNNLFPSHCFERVKVCRKTSGRTRKKKTKPALKERMC